MSLTARVKSRVRDWLAVAGPYFHSPTVEQILLRQEFSALRDQIRAATPDNPALAGYKIFSQTDEDGIIANIFQRIGEGGRHFIEIGCGDGTENNTHALLLQGWQGTWIDGGKEKIDHIAKWIPLDSPRLHVQHAFVTRDNVLALVTSALERSHSQQLDLLSVDIDGNDLHVLQRILTAVRPRVIISEYNGKFPPPLILTVDYNPTHAWAFDDYHGASLQAFVNILDGYRLVACNLSGANAFFVRNEEATAFTAYPTEALYQPARTHLIRARFGPPASLKFLRDSLRRS